MRRFKVGQEVVCIKKDGWYILFGTGKLVTPIENEIYTVSNNILFNGDWFISLNELPSDYCFNQIHFEPVVRIDELIEILEQQPVEESI
jgi:hypothetical protein